MIAPATTAAAVTPTTTTAASTATATTTRTPATASPDGSFVRSNRKVDLLKSSEEELGIANFFLF